MKRLLIFTGAAMLAVVPAAYGLANNASLSPSAPVSPPSQAVVDDSDDSSLDDASPSPAASATVSPSALPTSSAMPSPTASPDDHGGRTDRDDRDEAGDDRGTRHGDR